MISPLFRVHKLSPEGLEKAGEIAQAFDQLLDKLSVLCYPGREFSIVQTKLEEASFFAKKAMANFEGNQDSAC